MRIVRFLLRLVGWLLTPLVAWAASFFGAWLGALFVPLADRPTTGLILAIALGAVFAVTGTVLWMRILQKSPELREVLAVTAEGIPVVAIEAEQPEDARHPVSM